MFMALLLHLFTHLSGERHRPQEAATPFHEDSSSEARKEGQLPGAEFGE